MKTVHFTETDGHKQIDETLSLASIKRLLPKFFSESNTAFFKDQKYEVRRGQLIVYGIFEGSDRVRIPKISVYAIVLDNGDWDAFHLEGPTTNDEAYAIIDRFIDQARYTYGMFKDILDGSFFEQNDDDIDEDDED